MTDEQEFQFSVINNTSNYWVQVIELAKDCDNDFYPPLSQRMPIEDYFEKFNNDNGFVTIVTKNEKLIGISCGFLFHSDYKVAYSQFTLIDKDHRDKTLARKLINFVFKICKDFGAYFIKGRTWSTNYASRKLIKDTGFYQINSIINDRPNNVHTFEYEKCLFENNYFTNIKRLGILGGMGSCASAKLLTNICNLNSQTEKEQDQLPITLYSEPNSPDRSEYILANQIEILEKQLKLQLSNLIQQGVSHIVICCFTYHAALDLIDDDFKRAVVSLTDFTSNMLEQKKGKYLVLSSNGSFKLKLINNNLNTIYPDITDQVHIHDCINKIKKGEPHEIIVDELINYIKGYEVSGIVLAYTDLYLLSNLLERKLIGLEIINPLKTMAYNICDSWRQNIIN